MSLYEMLTLATYVFGGLMAYVIKDKAETLLRVDALLQRTREEIARDYVTKVEVKEDMSQLMNRFDRLEAKLDRVIEDKKSA